MLYHPFPRKYSLLSERLDDLCAMGRLLSETASVELSKTLSEKWRTVEEAVSFLERAEICMDKLILQSLIEVAKKSNDVANAKQLFALGKNSMLLPTNPVEQLEGLYSQGREVSEEESSALCERILRCTGLPMGLCILKQDNVAPDFAIQQSISELAFKVGQIELAHAIVGWGHEKGIIGRQFQKWNYEGFSEEQLEMLEHHRSGRDRLRERIDSLFLEGESPSQKFSIATRSHISTYKSLEAAVCFLETSDIKLDMYILNSLMDGAGKTEGFELVDHLFKRGKEHGLLSPNNYGVFLRYACESGHFRSLEEALDFLEKEGVDINSFDLRTLMDFAKKTGDFGNFMDLFELGKQKGILSSHNYTTFLGYACESGHFQNVEEALNFLKNEEVDLCSFDLTILMKFAGKTGDFKALTHLFELGKQKGILNKYHSTSLLRFAPTLQNELDVQALTQNMDTDSIFFQVLINNLVEQNRMEEARQLLEQTDCASTRFAREDHYFRGPTFDLHEMNYGTALLVTLDLSKTYSSFIVVTGIGNHSNNPYLQLRTKLIAGIKQHAPHLKIELNPRNQGVVRILRTE